jgi:VIT1/CCC1 family predicted Fe2+/Mn2+ transporter
MATSKKIKLSAADKKTVGQILAATAAGFLPIASYAIAHHEMNANRWLGILVAAALLFSAPTLAQWAQKWCKSPYKAWGFTVLLEGVMVFSKMPWLSISALVILGAINCHAAFLAAAQKPKVVKAAK